MSPRGTQVNSHKNALKESHFRQYIWKFLGSWQKFLTKACDGGWKQGVKIKNEDKNRNRRVLNIDKLYTKMGKVFRLPWELNLMLSCFRFSALYSRTYCNSWPSPPAYVLRGTGTVLYVLLGSVGLNLREEASAPSLYTSCCIIYLWY